MHTLNLGILAHVDAGKTTLTERLLFAAGAIDELGSVDAGSTQTDFLALERRRGITIRSAVASLVLGDVRVNLIDTPGHPDFIAEVERSLHVLDGAVLVVSAVEGVQAQTRVLMRTLRRLRIPTLLFVNKLDRAGADSARVLGAIAEKLTPAALAMGSARGEGTRRAAFAPFTAADAEHAARVADLVADHDDAFLAAYVEERRAVSYGELRRRLAEQSRRACVHPVFLGSAATGAGVGALVAGLCELLPSAGGDPRAPVAGTVFKIDRGAAGEKVAYVRLFSGTLRTRDRVPLGDGEGRVTALEVFDGGGAERRRSASAGEIARVRGLASARIGDAVGRPHTAPARAFAPPTLETVVVPRRPADRGALHVALSQLAEQDPLIDFRRDDARRELSVSLYGEVQKEVIQATLADDFGLEVAFRASTTICIERPAGTGAAVEIIDEGGNPFLATVGLRVDPGPAGAGVAFRLEVELGSMPLAFVKAVEETVRETLRHGLHGWDVTDCTVTLTHSGYWAKQSSAHGVFDKSMSSTARDFRQLTPLVLMAALARAGTQVLEPLHRFRLDVPADALGPLLSALARLRAEAGAPDMRGAMCALEGEIPAARVHELTRQLPALTRGEGVLESAFERHAPVRGPVPARPRPEPDPLDRQAYELQVLRPGAVGGPGAGGG